MNNEQVTDSLNKLTESEMAVLGKTLSLLFESIQNHSAIDPALEKFGELYLVKASEWLSRISTEEINIQAALTATSMLKEYLQQTPLRFAQQPSFRNG